MAFEIPSQEEMRNMIKQLVIVSLIWILFGFIVLQYFHFDPRLFLVLAMLIAINFYLLIKVLFSVFFSKAGVFFWLSAKFTCLMGILLVLWAGRKTHPSQALILGMFSTLVIPGVISFLRIQGKRKRKI